MNLLKVITPTRGLSEHNKQLAKKVSICTDGKRIAVRSIEQALAIKNKHCDEQTARELIRGIAEKNAHKPNFGESMLGLKRPELVSRLEKYLWQVEPTPEPISKN